MKDFETAMALEGFEWHNDAPFWGPDRNRTWRGPLPEAASDVAHKSPGELN